MVMDTFSTLLGLFVSVFIQVTPLDKMEQRSWVYADDMARRIILDWDPKTQTLELVYFEGEVSVVTRNFMVKNWPSKPGSFLQGEKKVFKPGYPGAKTFTLTAEKLFPEKRGTRNRWTYQVGKDVLGIELRLGVLEGFSFGDQAFEGTSDYFKTE